MLSSRVSTRRSGAARYRAPMPDQLRVAILGSGRSLHTKRWARRLAERGHEVHIYTVFPEPVEGVHVHDVLGRSLAILGRLDEARGQFEQALQIEPGNSEVRDHLAKLQTLTRRRLIFTS